MIDIAFAIVLLVAAFKGIRKGLVMALFSVLGFVIGIAAAFKLSAVAGAYLKEHVAVNEHWLPILSFAMVFFAIVLLVGLIGKLTEKTIELALMGWANKLGGAVLFVFLYSIIFSIVLFYAEKLGLLKPQTIELSVAYPYIRPLAPAVINNIGKIIPFVGESFAALERIF